MILACGYGASGSIPTPQSTPPIKAPLTVDHQYHEIYSVLTPHNKQIYIIYRILVIQYQKRVFSDRTHWSRKYIIFLNCRIRLY